MSIIESLKNRRTIYALNKELPVSKEKVIETIKEVTELTPDAFNMKSSRVVVALNDKQDQLWDAAYEAFGGQVAREKIDGFKAAAGTVLYFIDEDTVKSLQEQYALYADNFPVWANQASGMLQINVWSALRDLNIGASLQHYNPVIDEKVKDLFNVPANYKLVGQMPFGGIVKEADPKEKEDINNRVKVFN